MRIALNQALSVLVSLALVLPVHAAPMAAPAARDEDPEFSFGGEAPSAEFSDVERAQRQEALDEALRRLDLLMDALEELRFNIDRTQFDLEALALSLETGGAEAFITHVRDEIYFEPYRGLLRGAKGTLMSRAGNALDQAVLLATLMAQAGYEVRIPRATLSPEQARLLVEQMQVPRDPRAPAVDLDLLIEIVEEIADLAGVDDETLAAALSSIQNPTSHRDSPAYREVLADTEMILRLLDEAGIQLGDPQSHEMLTEEARDYFWVEYRRAVANPWRSVHPVFREGPDWLANLDATEVLEGDVPEELQHRLRFGAYIEQNFGREQRTHALMTPWERPTANLVAEPLVFQLMPDALPDPTQQAEFDLDEVLANTRFFFPTFNRTLADGAMAFDLNGNAVDPEAAGSPMSGVFQTGADRLGRAAGALDALGRAEDEQSDPADFVSLNSAWLEYTLIRPGGAEKLTRRSLADFEQARSAIGRSLSVEHTFMVAVGVLPDALVMNELLTRLIDSRVLFATAMRIGSGLGPVSVPLRDLDIDLRWLGHLELFPLFEADNAGPLSSYYATPGLAVFERTTLAKEEEKISVDIVANARRPIPGSTWEPAAAARNMIRQGVWETYAEALAISDRAPEGVSLAPAATRNALASDIDILTLEPSAAAELLALDIPPESRKAIERDMSNGFAVILPSRSAGSGYGWWRVHPRSGETLGLGGDGRGSATEDLTLKEFSGIVLLGAATSFAIVCIGERPAGKFWSCVSLVGGPALTGASMFVATPFFLAFLGAVLLLGADWAGFEDAPDPGFW